jgi:very-short-patch-repair endonuclease
MDGYKNKELVRNARVLRNNMTRAEIILWSRLRERKISGYKFRRQQPILDYIVDFYCPELKLIIEADGEIHSLNENSEYDRKRDNILKINGYRIIRFTNLEIVTELDSTINKISQYINELLSPFQGDHRGSQR